MSTNIADYLKIQININLKNLKFFKLNKVNNIDTNTSNSTNNSFNNNNLNKYFRNKKKDEGNKINFNLYNTSVNYLF